MEDGAGVVAFLRERSKVGACLCCIITPGLGGSAVERAWVQRGEVRTCVLCVELERDCSHRSLQHDAPDHVGGCSTARDVRLLADARSSAQRTCAQLRGSSSGERGDGRRRG